MRFLSKQTFLLRKHSSQNLCWTVSSNVVPPVWTWHSRILGHTDCKQADPWNQKGARSRIARAIFQISIYLRCYVHFSYLAKAANLLWSTLPKITPISRSHHFPFPTPKSAIPIFDHHTRCGSKFLLSIKFPKFDTAPSPRLVLRSPPMAPLRIPKVTEVSSCSPIASGCWIFGGVEVGINVSNTTTSTNQESSIFWKLKLIKN